MKTKSDAPELIGKYAVVTASGVVFECPISCGSFGAHDIFLRHVNAYPESPVAFFFDGNVRREYGRPLDPMEIQEAIVSSGY